MNRVISIAILLLIVTKTAAQDNYDKPLLFKTQKEIDEFQKEYPNVTTINNSVIIGIRNTDIHDLAGLSQLRKIKGDLTIKETHLKSLEPINKLNEITGTFTISYNNDLMKLANFNHLYEIGGRFSIGDNEKLESLEGLNCIKKIGGVLAIARNNSIENLNGLENINSINGYLNIRSNKNLLTLEPINIRTGIKSKNPTIAAIILFNNPKLSNCHCKTVIDVLIDSEKFTDVEKNDKGCASRQEILESYLKNPTDDLLVELIKNQPTVRDNYINIEMNHNGYLLFKDANFLVISRFAAKEGINKVSIPPNIKGTFSIWDESGTMKYISKK